VFGSLPHTVLDTGTETEPPLGASRQGLQQGPASAITRALDSSL